MIWHSIEIWLLLLLVFVAGCLLGSLLYLLIAETRLAPAQEAVADGVGHVIDRVRLRLGLAATWRTRQRARMVSHAGEAYRDYPDREPLRRIGPPPAVHAEEPAALGPIEDIEAALAGHDAEPDYPDQDWHEPPVEVDPDWHAEEVWTEEEEAEVAAIVAPDELLPEPLPEVVPAPVVEELPAMRPAGLTSPRNGVPDDLQRIRGIGKKNEELLNTLGIFHFGQIAAWTPAELRWVGLQIKFPERIERDDWIGQATVLASGGRTGYIKAEDRQRAAEEEAVAEELRAAARGEAG